MVSSSKTGHSDYERWSGVPALKSRATYLGDVCVDDYQHHCHRVMMKTMSTVMDAITAPVPEKCLAAQDTDWLTFTISVGLAFGIVLSYLPQVRLLSECQANNSIIA